MCFLSATWNQRMAITTLEACSITYPHIWIWCNYIFSCDYTYYTINISWLQPLSVCVSSFVSQLQAPREHMFMITIIYNYILYTLKEYLQKKKKWKHIESMYVSSEYGKEKNHTFWQSERIWTMQAILQVWRSKAQLLQSTSMYCFILLYYPTAYKTQSLSDKSFKLFKAARNHWMVHK